MSFIEKSKPRCNDSRFCFAQNKSHECDVLIETYKNGACPFCKQSRTITDGKSYPWNPRYADKN